MTGRTHARFHQPRLVGNYSEHSIAGVSFFCVGRSHIVCYASCADKKKDIKKVDEASKPKNVRTAEQFNSVLRKLRPVGDVEHGGVEAGPGLSTWDSAEKEVKRIRVELRAKGLENLEEMAGGTLRELGAPSLDVSLGDCQVAIVDVRKELGSADRVFRARWDDFGVRRFPDANDLEWHVFDWLELLVTNGRVVAARAICGRVRL